MNYTMGQRSKVLVTGVPWKDADSSAMDKERVPSRLNMLLRLHHGVLMECASEASGKELLGRQNELEAENFFKRRARARRTVRRPRQARSCNALGGV